MTIKMTKEQEKLVNENIKLAGFVARKFLHYFNNSTAYSYDDVFQIASIGLCKAAETYESDRDCSFSSYAYTVMRNEIADAAKHEYRSNRITNNAQSYDSVCTDYINTPNSTDIQRDYNSKEVFELIEKIGLNASRSVRIGLDALVAVSDGLTLAEYARQNGLSLVVVRQDVMIAKQHLMRSDRFREFYPKLCG